MWGCAPCEVGADVAVLLLNVPSLVKRHPRRGGNTLYTFVDCSVRYFPGSMTAKTAVIRRLSSELAIGLTVSPMRCMVHGYIVEAVWSQLKISSFGMSFITASAMCVSQESFLNFFIV